MSRRKSFATNVDPVHIARHFLVTEAKCPGYLNREDTDEEIIDESEEEKIKTFIVNDDEIDDDSDSDSSDSSDTLQLECPSSDDSTIICEDNDENNNDEDPPFKKQRIEDSMKPLAQESQLIVTDSDSDIEPPRKLPRRSIQLNYDDTDTD